MKHAIDQQKSKILYRFYFIFVKERQTNFREELFETKLAMILVTYMYSGRVIMIASLYNPFVPILLLFQQSY